MPQLAIHLLGPPRIERDGAAAAPPRGHKAWAVLAYLVLAGRPVSRSRLSALVFADAADPLGALRWTLAQLRRALDLPQALSGDPLELGLPAGTMVDVLALDAGAPDVRLVAGELLEGVDIRAGAVFETWLLVERRRLAATGEAVLREAALTALSAGDALDAATLAARALELDQFDESAHELLVRCLAAAGQGGAARHHATACEVLFRRELGRAPDARVRRAAEGAGGDPGDGPGDRAAATGQLEAGRAAVDAGAVEPGLACLRQATAEARRVGDGVLLARVLAALGTVLVHAVRGRDEEGSAVLHEALALARAGGARDIAAKVSREIAFVEVQAGRAASAGRRLLEAGALADDDHGQAAVLGVRGMALSDRARYAAAATLLDQSVLAARRCGDARQAAWSLAILGRAHLLCGRLDVAVEALDASLALVREEGWIAFQPFPEAVRAEAALGLGETARATELLDHAFSLGCRLGDPCWEALAARARGLVVEAAGDPGGALTWLTEATTRATRVADPYVWVTAYCLEAQARVGVAMAAAEAPDQVSRLERVAARADMRELVVRAALLRAALGDPDGVAAARLLGEAIDNPLLHAQLAAVS